MRLILCLDRQLRLVDDQVAVLERYIVVRIDRLFDSHSARSVTYGDRLVFIDGDDALVGVRIGPLRFVQRDRYELVCVLQSFDSHDAVHVLDAVIGCAFFTLSASVIGVCLILYDDRGLRLGDRQLARYVFYLVVVRGLSDRRCARYDLVRIFSGVGLLTVQRDARQFVTALEAGYFDLGREV